MKKLWVLFLIMICCALPVYGGETFEKVEPDRECQIAAGKIWRQKKNYKIALMEVIDNVIFIRTYYGLYGLSDEDEKAIRELAPGYEISILRNYHHEQPHQMQKYTFQAGNNDVQYNGMLLELEHTPYMQDGILMIPWREYMTLFDEVSNYRIQTNWIGGENQEIAYSMDGRNFHCEGVISIKNNTITTKSPVSYDNSMYMYEKTEALEGQVEIREGVAYYPFSIKNLKQIRRPDIDEYYTWDIYDNWNAETNQLTISLH